MNRFYTQGFFDVSFFIAVSNKWLHERGQEFRRPCGLTYDAD
jgi:hypothetical protein